MPTINLFQKKEYLRKYSSKRLNIIHSSVYNTSIWKNLRMLYLKDNPLCERCLKNKIITLAIDVHHIYPISQGNSVEEMQIIGFDINNLIR